jgi:transcriptional regulator with XRE-family HTH domain
VDNLVASNGADAEEDENEDASPLDEAVCNVGGCDYSGSERGLSIHQARAHGDDGGEPPTPEQIKALRAARGWTQSDLAEKLGAGDSTVANWETEHSTPGSAHTAQLWALREETFDDSDGDGTRGSPDTDAQSGGGEQAVDEDEGYPCPDCGATFDSERGRSIHRGHKHKHGDDSPEEDSDGAADDVTDQTPPHTNAHGTGELTPAVRALDEDRDGAGHPDGVDESDTGNGDAPERDYDQDLVVEDLDEVGEVRGRSLRQQVRAADGDVSDEQLAVQTGATIEVVQVLRSEVEAIEGRPDRGADSESASASPTSAPESSPSSGGPLRCQNCGAHVSRSYAAVFTPEDVEQPRVCPCCPDKIRERDGSVRDARSSRSNARRVDQ